MVSTPFPVSTFSVRIPRISTYGIRGILTLKVETGNGVETIRDALIAAEKISSPEKEIEVNCYYDGAPEYRIELRAPDFKSAEDTWTASIAAVVSVIESAGGTADSYRE